MAHGPPNQVQRWLCVVLVAAGGVMCLGFAGQLAAEDEAAAAVSEWPTAPGVVLGLGANEVREGRPGPGRSRSPGYVVWVRYRYTVEGQEYESERFNLSGGWTDKRTADAARERFPPGAACEVRYDPADPGRAYLVPDPPRAAWVATECLAVAGLLMLVLAGWGVWTRHSAEGAD